MAEGNGGDARGRRRWPELAWKQTGRHMPRVRACLRPPLRDSEGRKEGWDSQRDTGLGSPGTISMKPPGVGEKGRKAEVGGRRASGEVVGEQGGGGQSGDTHTLLQGRTE